MRGFEIYAAFIIIPVLLWMMLWSVRIMRDRAKGTKEALHALFPETGSGEETEAVDTVIFDIGNVLTTYAWDTFLQEDGLTGEAFERVANACARHPVWNEYDRGVWTEEEILNAFVRNDPEMEKEIRHAYTRSFETIIRKRERAVPWIKELQAAGCRVLYLSNFSEKAHRDCRDAMAFLDVADGGILSYTVKVTKPDPAIYRLLIERYDLKPERCVFVDDTPVNVEAARAMGMRGIVYETQEQAETALRELGIRY